MHDKLFEFITQYISLNDDEREAIQQYDLFRSVQKGTILLNQGETTDTGYFILKGCIRTYYVIEGEERTTGFYSEMELVTPHTVVNKLPSEYFVSTLEDTIITISNPEMEAEVFEKFPKFETLCRILSEQLLAKEQMNFDQFKTSSPEKRYLNLLEKRPDLIQRVPQHQIASYLGITPQSLSRLKTRIFKKK